jgi:hypothetical protein
MLLTFTSTLLSAADAFVGTWRLNATESKYSGGAREIKEATLTFGVYSLYAVAALVIVHLAKRTF